MLDAAAAVEARGGRIQKTDRGEDDAFACGAPDEVGDDGAGDERHAGEEPGREEAHGRGRGAEPVRATRSCS